MKNLRKYCVGRSMENAEGDPAARANLTEQAIGAKRPQENR